MIEQGEIYLVDFGKKYNSELGTKRPAVVLQNNFFNRGVESKVYKQVLLAPLSTQPIEDDYRMLIKKRDKLQKDSYIIANWICTLDFEHVFVDKGVVARLSKSELDDLKQRVCTLM